MAKRTIELTVDDLTALLRERFIGYTEGGLKILAIALADVAPGSVGNVPVVVVTADVTPHPDSLCDRDDCDEEAVSKGADGQWCKDHTTGVPVIGDW